MMTTSSANFDIHDEVNVRIDMEVQDVISRGAPIAISISGGKDSDCMVWELLRLKYELGLSNQMLLVHSDLGRAEHRATPAYIEDLARRTGLELYIVEHSYGDLLDGILRRMERRPDAPPFPSSAARWCTSDWKRSVIDKWIRNTFPSGEVVCAMGLRAEESASRAKKPIWERREKCCSRTRTVYNWLPIHHYSHNDVWGVLKREGGIWHPAYDRGNQRLSCAMCILASLGDIQNGIAQDQDLYRAYCDIEIKSGFSFRNGLWLGTLRPDLLRPDQADFYAEKGRS